VPRDDKGKAKPVRRESYNGQLPEPGALEYLFGYLCESGPLATWQELKAWQELTSTPLEPCEAALLWRLSNAYLDQQAKSVQPGCPPPWVDEFGIDEKEVAEKTKNVFRMLK